MRTWIILIGSLLILTTAAQAQDTQVIRISVTIPSIVGINSQEASVSSLEQDSTITGDVITQVEQIRTGNKQAVLKTILLK